MKSLTCVVVGDGSVIVVEIDERKKVGILKAKIKGQKRYKFPADQLTLYVAKKGGNWLKTDDPDVQRLENGEIPHGITALMNDDSKMNSKFWIRNASFGFPDEEHAGEDEIHVLIDVPQYVKTGPHYDRKARKMAYWYGIAALLYVALAVWYIFISGECLIIQEGRLEKWKVPVCVLGILLHVSPSVLAALLAWKWYWEARSKK